MYPVSASFLEALQYSGRRKTVVDLYYDHNLILGDVPIVGGSIKVDRNSRCRRSGSIQFADPTLFPTIFKGTGLSPYGVEAHVRSGVLYPNKAEELVPLGTFLVYSSRGDLASGFVPAVQLFDRAQRVYETSSWSAGDSGFNFGGRLVTEAISDLVMYAAPYWPIPQWTFDVNPNVALKDRRVPLGQYNNATDRWKMVTDLSLSIGAETYFDMEGNCKVAAIKYLPPYWAVQDVEWDVDGTLITASEIVTRENTFNSVIVVGSSKDSNTLPPFYIAYDDDPRSPTFWNGYFGKKTYRHEDSTLTTVEECQAVALDKLATLCGLSQTISFECLQNPALDVADVINVPLLGENNILMVESINLPLSTGSMTVETRSKQYVRD